MILMLMLMLMLMLLLCSYEFVVLQQAFRTKKKLKHFLSALELKACHCQVLLSMHTIYISVFMTVLILKLMMTCRQWLFLLKHIFRSKGRSCSTSSDVNHLGLDWRGHATLADLSSVAWKEWWNSHSFWIIILYMVFSETKYNIANLHFVSVS